MELLNRILSLDMANLTPEEIEWLHTLKNKAQALSGRLQLKYAEEKENA